MQTDRKAARCGRVQGDSARLGSAHHSSEVVLRKDSLKCHGLRRMLVERKRDSLGDREQTLLERKLWRRADYRDVDEGRPSVGSHVDNADAAPGQAGIDPENPERHRLLVFVEKSLHIVGNLEVGEDVLNVFVIFKRVDEAEHLASGLGIDLDRKVRNKLGL